MKNEVDGDFLAYLEKLGEKLKGLRVDNVGSIKTLSLTSGISPRQIARIEAGTTDIGMAVIYKYSTVLNIPMHELIKLEQW